MRRGNIMEIQAVVEHTSPDQIFSQLSMGINLFGYTMLHKPDMKRTASIFSVESMRYEAQTSASMDIK